MRNSWLRVWKTKDTNSIQVVHSILSILQKSKQEKTILFYSLYRKYFHYASVPPIMNFDKQFVQVDTAQAIEYLKSTYNFYSKEEREKILQDAADNFIKKVQ